MSGSSPINWAGYSRPSGKIDRDFGRIVHDMAVGQNESVGRDDETRSRCRRFRAVRAGRYALFDVDVHDRRRDAIDCAHDCARIFVQQHRIIAAGRCRDLIARARVFRIRTR